MQTSAIEFASTEQKQDISSDTAQDDRGTGTPAMKPLEESVPEEPVSIQVTDVESDIHHANRRLEHPIYSRFRAQRFVQFKHSMLFFLFAVVGTVTLVVVKSLTIPYPHVIHFMLVLLFMGTYFIINMSDFLGLKIRYDYLGDNLYYMGFVFTLGILAYTLYEFGGDVNNVSGVASSFGIALSSTVLGVIFRVVAHQLKIDPQEIDDAMRSELADMTSRLRASLDNVVRDMTIFGDQTRQAISELKYDVSNDVTVNVEKLLDASNRVMESADKSFNAFSENTSRMNDVAGKTVTVLSELIGKIEAIEAPSNIIEHKLIPATDQIEKIVAAIAASATQEEERTHTLKTVTDTMNATVNTLQERVNLISGAVSYEEVAAQIELAAKAIKEMSENMDSLRSQMTSLVHSENEALVTLRDEYGRTVETIRDQKTTMKEELDNFRSLTSETQEALIELARSLKNAI